MNKFVGFIFFSTVVISQARANDAFCPPGSNKALQKIELGKIIESPKCFKRQGDESNEAIADKNQLTDFEVLARLAFAEGISTNMEKCEKYGESIFESIAWGVHNRVELTKSNPKWEKSFGKGYRGVIFKKAQFNPAVSKKSTYSTLFLCPTEHPLWKVYWQHATEAANKVVTAPDENPFLKGPKTNGVSAVTHFYYPQSSQATNPPVDWANLTKTKAKNAYVKNIKVNGSTFSNECVQFFSYAK
ncbi:hypothetical protein [Bdellovibrio sp. HCB-110]|uniref:hypothetical protein n=1 Tax=Bdellovibrio sp. HCB-110 TaxID=3391182 RepID=UPI0039B435C3